MSALNRQAEAMAGRQAGKVFLKIIFHDKCKSNWFVCQYLVFSVKNFLNAGGLSVGNLSEMRGLGNDQCASGDGLA